jgi:enoyl-CoA hydratase
MLPITIGAAATKELLFTGDLIDADEAHRLGIVSHVVAPEALDERTMAFCQRMAMTPLDALTVHRHVTNRWLEVMGLRLAAMEGAEYDAIFHMAPSYSEFTRRSREEGLRAALDWRDGPFRTGPAADHDAAIRRHR